MNILLILAFVPSIAQKFAEYVNITGECEKAIEYNYVDLNKTDRHIITCDNGDIWQFDISKIDASMEVKKVDRA